MEEQCLRCNRRSPTGGICRRELYESAIVTTCSHVLCAQCAEVTGFTGGPSKNRKCPVCAQPLPNVDDAATMNLRPTEDYKMSVLCGLDPATIIECASSALSFWNYQMLQETEYQKHLLVALSKKYNGLNGNVNKIVEEANHEIDDLHRKIEDVSHLNAQLQQKNVGLSEGCRERDLKYAQLRKGYENLKKVVQQNKQNQTNEEVAEQVVHSFIDPPGSESMEGLLRGRPIHNAEDTTRPTTLHKTPTHTDRRRHDQADHYHCGGSDSQYSGEVSRMFPPQRPLQATRISPSNIQSQNRTPLGTFRAAADRSQKTLSANRLSNSNRFTPVSSDQHHTARGKTSHNINHSRHNSVASYGGISAGMKVGGPITDSQIRRQSGYVPLQDLPQQYNNPGPHVSQHF